VVRPAPALIVVTAPWRCRWTLSQRNVGLCARGTPCRALAAGAALALYTGLNSVGGTAALWATRVCAAPRRWPGPRPPRRMVRGQRSAGGNLTRGARDLLAEPWCSRRPGWRSGCGERAG
jgi:hypothetical protein